MEEKIEKEEVLGFFMVFIKEGFFFGSQNCTVLQQKLYE